MTARGRSGAESKQNRPGSARAAGSAFFNGRRAVPGLGGGLRTRRLPLSGRVGPPVRSESHDQAREIQHATPTIGPVSMSRHNSPQGIADDAGLLQRSYLVPPT